jgi:hypothetical protein
MLNTPNIAIQEARIAGSPIPMLDFRGRATDPTVTGSWGRNEAGALGGCRSWSGRALRQPANLARFLKPVRAYTGYGFGKLEGSP